MCDLAEKRDGWDKKEIIRVMHSSPPKRDGGARSKKKHSSASIWGGPAVEERRPGEHADPMPGCEAENRVKERTKAKRR